VLPPLVLRDLTIPEPGSGTAKAVLSRAVGGLLRELAGAPLHAPPGVRAEAAALSKLVRAAVKEAPGPLASALRRPTVGGLLRCLRIASLPRRDDLFVEMTALLALELARTGSLPASVRLGRAPSRLLSLPGRFALHLPADARGLVIENGRVTVERAGGVARVDLAAPVTADGVVVERPYHLVAGDIALALADNSPLALVEAHPDKQGNALDLGGRAPSAWTEALSTALARIARHLPDLHREMQLFIAQVVPVGYDAEEHLSASYQEIIGSIYMTLHPGSMTLSEALIHEFSHNKLNALFELDDVLENAFAPLYASPVRPDPRPLHGVLLAVHAFLPVARLYERMIEAGDPLAQGAEGASFARRFAAVRRINHEGAELVLREGRPTAVGRGPLDEIRRWDAHYARFDG
jgi:HEXXH motif-containing protein